MCSTEISNYAISALPKLYILSCDNPDFTTTSTTLFVCLWKRWGLKSFSWILPTFNTIHTCWWLFFDKKWNPSWNHYTIIPGLKSRHTQTIIVKALDILESENHHCKNGNFCSKFKYQTISMLYPYSMVYLPVRKNSCTKIFQIGIFPILPTFKCHAHCSCMFLSPYRQQNISLINNDPQIKIKSIVFVQARRMGDAGLLGCL